MGDFFNKLRFKQGIELIKKGKIKEASEYYELQLANAPSNQFLHTESARAYFKLGNMEETKKHLRELINMDFSKQTIETILEITNWRMIAHPKYFNQSPVFSSDGKFIVFASARQSRSGTAHPTISDTTGLYRFNLLTGAEELLVDGSYYNCSPCISPDNTKLLFLSARRDTDGNNIIDHRDNRGLYILDLSTGKEEMLLNDDHKIKHPSFSPDGNSIIFYCNMKGSPTGNIYLLKLSDKRPQNLTPDDFESTFPSLSPIGDCFVFSSWRNDTNGNGQVTIRDNSGLYCRELTSFREIEIASDKYDNSFPSFSPDGRYIVFLSRRRDTNNDGIIDSQDNSGIYQFDLKKLKEKVLITDEHYNKYPAFLPNGKGLIFISSWIHKKEVSNQQVEYFEKKGIYTMDMTSWKISKIVNDKYYSSHNPVASPDSNYAVYSSWRAGLSRGLYLAKINGLPSKEELESYINNNL